MNSNFGKNLDAAKKYDDKVISDFKKYLANQGLSEKTVTTHGSNIDFFAEYINYYGDSENARVLTDAGAEDISGFLGDWFPRKAMWSSPYYVKSYISSFKKFFVFLESQGLINKEALGEIKNIIREEKEDWILSNEF